jgi:hypothetical protein
VHANRTCCRQLGPHRHVARASRFRVIFVAGSDDQFTPIFSRSRRSPMQGSLFVWRSTLRARQVTKSYELHSALSLSRLFLNQGKRAATRQLLLSDV